MCLSKKHIREFQLELWEGISETGDLGGDSELITLGGDISAGNVRGGINMETYGGDLTLAGANGKVSAKTSGGNIIMRNISGSVTVKTPSGNIDVTLFPAPNSISEISTSNGSIDLHVPQNAKTTIRAKVRTYDYSNSDTERKIYSEYPASESSKKSGSYNRYVYNQRRRQQQYISSFWRRFRDKNF